MKRISIASAIIAFAIMAGCSSDGIVFNGVKQVEQFPVRKTPIVHYNLPSEVIDPITGDASIDVSTFSSITSASFVELAAPGHDLWQMNIGGATDNPNAPLVTDWDQVLLGDFLAGPSWPDATVVSQLPGTPGTEFIARWVLSIQNQHFLRGVDGSSVVPVVAGQAPVQYESVLFGSHAISLIRRANMVTDVSQLPAPAQREAIATGGTPGVGANGDLQIVTPASNLVDYAYNGIGAPAGLIGIAFRELPAANNHVEDSWFSINSVPVPDYFGAGGNIAAGGGVAHSRFMNQWLSTTRGTASANSSDDGVVYSYYLAAIGNHLIGYGVGLIDSSFALPGAVNNQEGIMNLSVILDMTAFIAAGKEFQFVVEDHLRMQDTVNGDYITPGPKSALPGTFR